MCHGDCGYFETNEDTYVHVFITTKPYMPTCLHSMSSVFELLSFHDLININAISMDFGHDMKHYAVCDIITISNTIKDSRRGAKEQYNYSSWFSQVRHSPKANNFNKWMFCDIPP